MSKLSTEQVKAEIEKLDGWSLNANGEIMRTYSLSGFVQALAFVSAVGLLAEAAQHHPDISINWRRVTLALTTHDEGGLSEKDFDLAQQINRLPLI
jgi:4a-hydroxytetrahydrobiopterin dehydratase